MNKKRKKSNIEERRKTNSNISLRKEVLKGRRKCLFTKEKFVLSAISLPRKGREKTFRGLDAFRVI
jgi:hypothetical protein